MRGGSGVLPGHQTKGSRGANPDTIAEAEAAVDTAWRTAWQGLLPPPLEDSPKCPRCSLAPLCLPDESALLETPAEEPRQLSLFSETPAPRKPPGQELRRVHAISQLCLMGNIQVTKQAMQALLEDDIPVCYFSQGGYFYGIAQEMGAKNGFCGRRNSGLPANPGSVPFWRQLVAVRIRNQRTLLMRNHTEPSAIVLKGMREMAEEAEQAPDLDRRLGIEGNGARLDFSSFTEM